MVRRARAPRTARAPRAAGEYHATSGSVGGGDLVQAAEEIADGARKNAAEWSTSIPPNIRTESHGDHLVNVVSDAPAAYPAETRASHPLFARGPREEWIWRDREGRPFGPPGRAFLRPAADERAGAAMAKYAKKIDRLCHERGFE